MKSDFIIKFIQLIIDSGKEIHSDWKSQPLCYKGWRVSGYPKAYKGFDNLKQRKIIKELPGGRFKFTNEGKEWFKGSLFRYYKIMGTKWDKKWRVVIFDVPQEYHLERNKLRSKLKTLGFHMIQKSIFAFPYPCEKEISEYCNKIKVADYVDIMIVEKLGGTEKQIRKFYKL